MKSNRAKVLHELFFKPMLHHVLDTVNKVAIDHIAVIVGHQREKVLQSLEGYEFTPVFQEEQLGTGHAVLCAREACRNSDQVMILCGDTPLIRSETLQAMAEQHHETGARITLMTTEIDDPFGYGRIITDAQGHVLKIVEHKDADTKQQAIREINAGIYLVETDFLFTALAQVGTDNSQGEVYLTDIVAIAVQEGHEVHRFVHTPAIDVLGVNSRVELALAHAELQMRHNRKIMLSGVTMYGPETILLSPDSTIGRDCVLQAGVQVTGRSRLAEGCQIGPGVRIHKSELGRKCIISANAVLHNCTIENEEHIPPLTSRVG
jgi:bifunctional UDP-N-acetylglucosamine pyrophosphorylase/glucosamine-1-phosphate N-acetyltransferase